MTVGLLLILLFGIFFLVIRKYLSFSMATNKKGVNERIYRGLWVFYWGVFAFIILGILTLLGVIQEDSPYAWLVFFGLSLAFILAICYFTDFRIMKGMLSYKSQDYYRQTGNSLKEVLGDVFLRGEYDLFLSLSTMRGYKRIVVNPRIPGLSGKLFEADMICITEKAIIVADSLFKDGRWSGEMLDEIWGHETRTARFSMPNPLISNQERIIALNNFLCDKNQGYYKAVNKDRYINFVLCGLNSQLVIKGNVPHNCMVFSRQVEKEFYKLFDQLEAVYDRGFVDRLADLLEKRRSYDGAHRKKALEKKYKPTKSGKAEQIYYAATLSGDPLTPGIVRLSEAGFAWYRDGLFTPTSAAELTEQGYGRMVSALKAGGREDAPVFDQFHNVFGQNAQIQALLAKSDAPRSLEAAAGYLEEKLEFLPVYYTSEK